MPTFSRTLAFISLFAFAGLLSAFAQTEQAVDLDLNPTFPKPHQIVSVSAETYSFDISRAQTTWRVDGEVVRQGRSIKGIDVQLGDIGEATTVSFTATQNGQTISQTRTIVPGVVDIVVEPDTYTPPLYKGRTLPSHEARMRVVATAFLGEKYSQDEIVYTWRVDGQVQGSKSGAGKSTFMMQAAPYTQRTEIRVDATSPDGQVHAREVVQVKSEPVQVLLYAINPLLGLDTNLVLSNETELDEEEVTISAEPFYFPGLYRESLPVEYTWKLNGKTVSTSNSDDGTITLRQAGEGRGRAQIAVSIQHPEEVVIRGGSSASFTFGITESGPFGF